jgi:phosphopantothenoylcysteine decarboxylase / phosphopantothenate---cysteine ligase
MKTQSVTLIISGSIAAVKAPELIRQLRAKKIGVRCIVTRGGEKFVSLKEVETLSGHPVSTDLFAEEEMRDMWHIRFSRETDLIVVAPATADIIAKMAQGLACDMASATLLANNKKLLVAPAMNTHMWVHPATQRNVKQIIEDGAQIIEPGVGMLACGEVGAGRMAEPKDIVAAIQKHLDAKLPLKGKKALVTSGPTYEAIDPVRFIGNRSSGKQGHAIAAALAQQGAAVTLVAGPTSLPDPAGVAVRHVTSAAQMLSACEKALPVDVAVCAAAVGDWRTEGAASKLKKEPGKKAPTLTLIENPDILKHIAGHKKRPKLVIGFAAETEKLRKNSAEKRKKKKADWIVANDVAGGKVFNEDSNEVTLITARGAERWPLMSKDKVAEKLVAKIITHLGKKT